MQPFEPDCVGMIPCISLSQRMQEAGVPIYGYTGCIAGHMAEAVEIGPEISRASIRRAMEAQAKAKAQK